LLLLYTEDTIVYHLGITHEMLPEEIKVKHKRDCTQRFEKENKAVKPLLSIDIKKQEVNDKQH